MQIQQIALITCESLGSYTANADSEDERLYQFLKGKGLSVSWQVWDNASVDWSQFDALIIKSPWDYFDKIDAFYSWLDKVEGIEAGADDYLAKPFEPAELVVRVRALIRRSAGHSEAVLQFGPLMLDTRRMAVMKEGTPITLSPLEYRLIHTLAHSGGRPLSAGALAEALHGADSIEDNAIEAMIARLRRKLGADSIVTRRGFGYLLAHA